MSQDYIQKVILLEKRVGTKVGYAILVPFPVNSRDVISIQMAAKRITEFIGLHGLTFIVSPTETKEKVGAVVELEHGAKEVFVDISDDVLSSEKATLAALAHEITHKYLQINAISCGTGPFYEYENEVLTDIAAVFLGLGKLLLNGYEDQNVRQYAPTGTRTTTSTLKVGYLDRTQVAFVYRLVCAMRNIPRSNYERGLSSASLQSLRECQVRYGHYFDDRFHSPNMRSECVERLSLVVHENQSILSVIDAHLSYLQAACIDVMRAFLEEGHKRIAEVLTESRKAVNNGEYDPALRFLNTMQLDQRISQLVSEQNDYSAKAKHYRDNVANVTDHMQMLGDPFPPSTSEMYQFVVCRNDGTLLRRPGGSGGLIAECHKCGYRFAVTDVKSVSRESRESTQERAAARVLRRLFRMKEK